MPLRTIHLRRSLTKLQVQTKRHLNLVAAWLLFFISWLLLIPVAFSLPLIKSVYLFELAVSLNVDPLGIEVAGASDYIRFGVWGLCNSGVDISVLVVHEDVSKPFCTAPHLGFNFDSRLIDLLHINSWTDVVSEGLTDFVKVHFVCWIFALLSWLSILLLGFMLSRRESIRRGVVVSGYVLCGGLSLLTLILTAAVVGVDRKLVVNFDTGFALLGKSLLDVDLDVSVVHGNGLQYAEAALCFVIFGVLSLAAPLWLPYVVESYRSRKPVTVETRTVTTSLPVTFGDSSRPLVRPTASLEANAGPFYEVPM